MKSTHVSESNGKPDCTTDKKNTKAVPPTSRPYKLLLLVSIALTAVYWSRKGAETDKTYAICSKDGSKAIYTVNDNNTVAECMLVEGHRIAAIGSLSQIRERCNGGELIVHYIPNGSVVIPGMTDSHCHMLEYGASRQIPLSTGKNAKETVNLVAEYILAHPELKHNTSRTIQGWGWDHASWDVAKFPTWNDFEENPIVRGRRVVLRGRDGHALWVSRATLDANFPYPESVSGGVIVRDADGNPTGVFVDSAQELVDSPRLTTEDLEEHFQTTVKDALAHGLTSLHDAGFKPESLEFFKQRITKDILPLRIYGMTYFDEHGEYWGNQRSPMIGAGNGRLTTRSVKIFADGALRTAGAALYEPYADQPTTNGQMRLSNEVLNTVIPKFLKDGWQVNVHAIGDRANGIVLDAFEAALKGVNVTALRPRLEHAQIMTKEDMKRLGKLGVIVSVQPTHAISDMGFAEDRLGPERVKGLYAFRTIIDSGARITLGSDFPVEGINPLAGFYAAISRLSFEGTSPHGPGGWFPEQRLTREEALRGMTIDPAYASFTEDQLGSLEVGKIADFVILSQDIMTVAMNEVMQTNVLATILDGDVVYGSL
ncbi:amidohydrolase family-domain-containing protein [Cyathus striatus]|nr:amidohydrolase family-domain-containing protein [Cyathus striatus]